MAKHRFVIDGQGFDVEVHSTGVASGYADVTVNGARHRVEVPRSADAKAVAVAPVASKPRSRPTIAAPGELRAPMAGLVLKTPSVGQHVRAGDALIVLDAMKMENTLAAATDGVVQDVPVSRGDTVLRGALLVRLG